MAKVDSTQGSAVAGATSADGGNGVRHRTWGRDGRPQVHRPARHLAAHDPAACSARRRRLRVRARLRRLLDPRLPGDPRVGHAADAGPDDRVHRPLLHASDAVADLLGRRPGARRALRARPAVRRAEGRAAPGSSTGIADVAYFGPEAEFFVFDHIAYSQTREPRVLRGRLRRGLLEHGRRRPSTNPNLGLQAAPEGGLLPGAAGRLDGQPARRDGADDGVARDQVRVPPPRGLLGRPGRDRHALPAAAADGRPDDDLQVRGQEHRPGARARPRPSCRSRSSRRTARACTCTSRCGRTATR